MTAIQLYDALEKSLPVDRFLSVSNGKRKINIAGQSQAFRKRFEQGFEQTQYRLRKACNQAGVPLAVVPTSLPFPEFVKDVFTARRSFSKGRR